jgi:hypothetical protein
MKTTSFLTTSKSLWQSKVIALALCIALFFVSCDDDPTLGGSAPVSLDACMPSNLQSDLIVYYGFDNGSLQDLSGNSRHLANTTTANPSTDRNGSPTCAYHFDRSNNEFLSRTNGDFLNSLNEISFSLWFNPDTLVDQSPFEMLLCRGEGGHCPNTHGEWSLALFDCRRPVLGYGDNSYWAEMVSPQTDTWCQDNTNLTDGIWHHLAATYDGATCTVWLDGVPTSYPVSVANCFENEVMEDIGIFYLGKDYSGLLDDVAVFDRALTASEVDQLRQWSPCCAAP